MFIKTDFGTSTPFRNALTDAGLDTFAALMAGSVGEVRKLKADGQEVRYLKIRMGEFERGLYLKRSGAPSIVQAIKSLLRVRPLHTASYREFLMVRELEMRGLPVMRAVAWGERRVLGQPRRGFVLVEEVIGEPMDKTFEQARPRMRERIMLAAGQLMGRLNNAGFYQPVRMRDVICTQAPDDELRPVGLVLIDRESSGPPAREFDLLRSTSCLARSYCKHLQAGFKLTASERAAFLEGYMEKLTHNTGSADSLLQRVCEQVGKLTAPGGKYAGLAGAEER